MYRLKVIDDVLYFTADYATPRGYQLAEKIERLTQRYLKFFLVAAIVALAFAWVGMLQDIQRTVAFAQFLHAQQL